VKFMIDLDLKKVLMTRDGLSELEALNLIDEARELVMCGEDPEELLFNEFGLEPDYIFDLLCF